MTKVKSAKRKMQNNNSKFKIQNSKFQSGYALMLSIVVSSIVLSIGLSLFNIVQKELILSATGRDSQFAFYSADGGIECALYWDIKELAFPSSEADWNSGNPPSVSGDGCGTTDFSVQTESRWNEIDDLPVGVTENLNTNGTPYACVSGCGVDEIPVYGGHEDDIVTLTFQIEFQESSEAGYQIMTTVESKGYNDECALDNPALVERAISVTY
ncbi:MAG: hypothetical protein HYT29_02450 [Parcubacteria group bacterium]|nr:hypothetical protein [Parcubacteria group bacterium]